MYSHYFKDVSHLDKIDVYRVIDLFGVTHPALAHAAKKILVSGNRGIKDEEQDIKEAIDALLRYMTMRREDGEKLNPLGDGGETVSMLDKLTLNLGNTWTRADLPEATAQSYADESGYTEQDLQAASLVHDATPLDPELVELCSKTEIHADTDGWIPHVGDKCPLADEWVEVYVRFKSGVSSLEAKPAYNWYWGDDNGTSSISHWRYAVPRKD